MRDWRRGEGCRLQGSSGDGERGCWAGTPLLDGDGGGAAGDGIAKLGGGQDWTGIGRPTRPVLGGGSRAAGGDACWSRCRADGSVRDGMGCAALLLCVCARMLVRITELTRLRLTCCVSDVGALAELGLQRSATDSIRFDAMRYDVMQCAVQLCAVATRIDRCLMLGVDGQLRRDAVSTGLRCPAAKYLEPSKVRYLGTGTEGVAVVTTVVQELWVSKFEVKPDQVAARGKGIENEVGGRGGEEDCGRRMKKQKNRENEWDRGPTMGRAAEVSGYWGWRVGDGWGATWNRDKRQR